MKIKKGMVFGISFVVLGTVFNTSFAAEKQRYNSIYQEEGFYKSDVVCSNYYKHENEVRLYVSKQHNYIAKNLNQCKYGKGFKETFVPGYAYPEYYTFPRPPAFYPHSIQQEEIFNYPKDVLNNY